MLTDETTESVEEIEDFQTLERHANETQQKDVRSDVIEAVPPLYMRGTIYLFVAVMIICLLLTYFMKVYVIIPAKGLIVPEGQKVIVEAESPGIVTSVLITPGNSVKKGQIILELRQDAAGIDFQALKDQLSIQTKNRAKAIKSIEIADKILADPSVLDKQPLGRFSDAGSAMVFVANLRTVRQALQQVKTNFFVDVAEQKKLMKTQIKLQNSTILNLRHNQSSTAASLKTLEKSLERKHQDLQQTMKLAKARVVTEIQVGQARDQLLSAENTLNQQRRQLGQLRLSETQARVEIGNQKSQFTKLQRDLKTQVDTAQTNYDKAIAELSGSIATFEQALLTTNANIAQLQGKIRLQETTINKLSIRSPVDGEITSLNFNTKGQSVGAGSKVATIIPTGVRPMVMVAIANKDVAGVKEGTVAKVKVDAYPFRQFGTVPAKVASVYPIANKPEFAVRVELEKNFIKVNQKEEPLEPGLTVQVDLLSKRKRIIELLFKKMN